MFKQGEDNIEDMKTTMFYELQEESDKKLQRMLENMQQENMRLWKQNVEIADSDLKEIGNEMKK